MKNVTLNDLPMHSKWPARLLGLVPWEQREKTKEEINREYELESWGAYLKRIQDEGMEKTVTTVDLDYWQGDPDDTVVYTKGDAYIEDTWANAYTALLETVRSGLAAHLPADTIVELGCGYGSVILNVADDPRFAGVKWKAAEYAPSGVELTAMCARNQGHAIDVGSCDFMSEPITDLDIEPGAVIFTCTATCTLPELPDSFVEGLVAFKPRRVVHFEPCYEHQQDEHLLSLMRRRYIEVNDYNRNLLTLLRRFEASGAIRIIDETPSVVGENPLFPVSVITWECREA